MSGKIASELQSYRQEHVDLETKLSDLLEEKRKVVLQKKDAAEVNKKIEETMGRINDINTILLPEMEQQLQKAKEKEAEETRLKTIKQILDEDMRQLEEGKMFMAKLVECHNIITESMKKIDKINSRHNQITTRLLRLDGSRPEGYKWEPLIVPTEFDDLVFLGKSQISWLQKWRKK